MSAASEERERVKAERCALAKCPLAGEGDERCKRCTGPVSWTGRDGRRRGVGGAIHRSCTSCPMNGLGLPVCWAGCDGPNPEFLTDGQSMVTLGGMQDADTYLGQNMAYDAMLARLSSADAVTQLGREAEAAVMHVVRMFSELNLPQLKCLQALLKAGKCAEAARMLGVTKQAVNATSNRIAQKLPELRPFLFVRHRND